MADMEAKVHWHQNMSFTGTAGTGFSVPLGAPPEVGGASDGFRPIELMLVSLAGCTAMDTISILMKKRQEVTGFDVEVHGKRAAEHPKVYTQITVEYIVTGHNIDESAVKRAVELSAEKYCPAQAMLSQIVPIEHKITIREAV